MGKGKSIKLLKCIQLIDEIDENTLSHQFNNIDYVNKIAEEPCTGLILAEVEYLLDNMTFSKKKCRNQLIKLIIYLHCLGYSDLEITNGLNKIRTEQITIDALKKTRQRALKQLEEYHGGEIGFITIMYEAFKTLEFMDNL